MTMVALLSGSVEHLMNVDIRWKIMIAVMKMMIMIMIIMKQHTMMINQHLTEPGNGHDDEDNPKQGGGLGPVRIGKC